ncbi:hypothetical protein EVB68_023 [Rhizobium phage RHph_Y2_6]|uniref:Uncharacterized protein n=1 Tax=Rhizobium phage RHph_Y2_6 TaxID=2509576 RepID=A0A7S5USB3_9CAUD|nr:hypothetical protein PP748_gp023 [Rhizobium phage RHph_Y2_6]QIG68760.1 hypothetical protein EVB68_023 [Rhizobium phage RHph_Y2_6]
MPMHMNEWRRSLTQITGKTAEQVLEQFYKQIYVWICRGTPQHKIFDTEYGICANLLEYMPDSMVSKTRRLLRDQFIEAGLDDICPFNQGDYDIYKKERDAGLLYRNPLRLKWIEDHAT